MGLEPITPGFARFRIKPQLGDLTDLDLIARTVRGDISFRAGLEAEKRTLELQIPEDTVGELLLPEGSQPGLYRNVGPAPGRLQKV